MSFPVSKVHKVKSTTNSEGIRTAHTVYAASGDNSNSTRTKLSNTKSQTFSQSVGTFFKNIYYAFANFIRKIYGLAEPNEVPHALYKKRFQSELENELQKSQNADNEIKARAQVLLRQSQEVIDYVSNHNIANLPQNIGVQMSPTLSFLAGVSNRQRFEHNCAINFWARNILSGRTILDIEDLDNTNLNKNASTWGTSRIQSIRVRHWNRLAYILAREHLGAELLLNTARTMVPGAIYARNEGLEGSATIGEHGSPLGEIYGRSLIEQIRASEFTQVATANGTLIHKPWKPTKFSNKLLRAAEIMKFFNGITIDDKTFIEAYFKGPTEEHEFTAAEPKGVPSYLLDTHKVLGESYYPNYLQIVQLKEQYVDKRRKGINKEEGWRNFAIALKEDVHEGIEAYRRLDRLKRSGASEQKLEEARRSAYKHIRLIGADSYTKSVEAKVSEKVSAPDYYRLLTRNPQAFFEKVTECRLTGLNYHYFNSRGTPVTRMRNKDGTYGFDATEQAIYTLNKFANHPHVQERVRELNSISTGKALHPHIQNFRDEGINILKNDGLFDYLNWRMTKHLMHLYTRGQLQSIENCRDRNEGKRIFNCSDEDELKFDSEFLAIARKVYNQKGLQQYIKWLQNQFSQSAGNSQYSFSSGVESELVNFISTMIPENLNRNKADISVCDSKGKGINFSLEHFLPNELFSINNKCAYSGKYDFISIFSLVDKRDMEYVGESPKGKKHIFIPYQPTEKIKRKLGQEPLGYYAIPGANPDAQYYPELLSGEKFSVVPAWEVCKEKNYSVISAGDSKSDIGTHVLANEFGCNDDPRGMSEVVFGLINDDDIYEEAFKQRLKYLDDAKNDLLLSNGNGRMGLSEAHEEYGIYAIRKVGDDRYKKVTDIQLRSKHGKNGNPEFKYYCLDKHEYTKEEILKDIEKAYANRIIHNRCPEAKIRRRAEIIELLTGKSTEFNESEYNRAVALYEKKEKGIALTSEERAILEPYEWAIIENKNESFVSQEAPRFRVWYEYHDQNGKIYYRRKTDGQLVSKDEKLFTQNEKGLTKIPIQRNLNGDFVRIIDGKEEPFYDIDFINNCLCEEEVLPSASPKQGLFASKGILNCIGLGNARTGERRLKILVTHLPGLYNKVLEWSGGLMALGGLIRLVSKITGSLEEILYQTGYWMSNGLRAVSAFGGALRGELNVQKHHNIAAGEFINAFAALAVRDGWKHFFLGLGNFVLFLGRGQQRAQMMQRINNHPDAVLKGKPDKDKYVDPRPYVRDVTEFSTQMILNAKKSAKGFGLPPILGEVVGNIASAILTPVQMIRDVFRDPRLIFQVNKRRAEKSGEYYTAFPSAGHLLAVVGALSGIGALIAGTIGRMKDVSEDGFNKIGKFFISFANAIAAPGVIANGIEVMANPQGLPRLSKDLTGKDLKYDPKRAGLGQIIAGIGYGVMPWFGLHKKEVASVYDIVNGIYFGLPGARMSVAEEEKLNTIALARNKLIEGQQYYQLPESALVKAELPQKEVKRKAA